MTGTQQVECPACGTPIAKTHHCRASALNRVPGVPPGVRDLVEEEKAAHRAEAQQELLTLEEPLRVSRCAGCGREDRVIVHQADQLCMPCLRFREAGAA